MIENVKLGADPELFLEKDGELISAEGLIGGTKEKPLPITDKGHYIQEDNVMVEFNIPPCSNVKDFVYNINQVKGYLETAAEVQGAKLNFSASGYLDYKYLQTEQAMLFGCEPDINIYLGAENTIPEALTNLRVCGGHIHIGFDNPSFNDKCMLVYAMDAILGLESVLLDEDTDRKQMYGKAGSFREKEYGIEYRTLSNFWIKDDASIAWAFNKTLEAIELVNSGDIEYIVDNYAGLIQKAINKNDKELAKSLISTINKKEIKLTA